MRLSVRENSIACGGANNFCAKPLSRHSCLATAGRKNQLVQKLGLNVGDVRVRLIEVNLPIGAVLAILPNQNVERQLDRWNCEAAIKISSVATAGIAGHPTAVAGNAVRICLDQSVPGDIVQLSGIDAGENGHRAVGLALAETRQRLRPAGVISKRQ